jgi:two-component system LytT family sensor kinase
MQLQPHFLFNALHSISSLMHHDIESADRMLARLAELLRLTIRTSDSQVVPLEQELDELKPYLEIERIRFGDRLAVKIDVDDVHEALIPHMILQPLIENAIRHGISPLEDGGKVHLKAHRDGDWLVLIVADNGVGFKDEMGSQGHGVGLGNTRTCLLHLYGEHQQLEVLRRNGRGSIVKIRIPLETELTPGSLMPPAPQETAEVAD